VKKLAIMQPYFFPYIGYFQLINAVDTFVVYDNIEFTKKGWFNRNRLLLNNKVEYFTINIKKDSDYLDVRDRVISPVYFEKGMPKILRQIEQSYKKAPFFETVFPLIREIFEYREYNLFGYIYHSILRLVHHFGLSTEVLMSSTIPIDHTLRGKWKIFEICRCLSAGHYVNPIGGTALYSKSDFLEKGIILSFISTKPFVYHQFGDEFVPNLSIIDVMMFNSLERIRTLLDEYELV